MASERELEPWSNPRRLSSVRLAREAIESCLNANGAPPRARHIRFILAALEAAQADLAAATARVERAERERDALDEERSDLIGALTALRELLIGLQKRAGYLPEQGGYSTTMTSEELEIVQAIKSLSVIIARADVGLMPAPEEPR